MQFPRINWVASGFSAWRPTGQAGIRFRQVFFDPKPVKLLPEQIGVRAGPGEDQFSAFSQVDHEPVGFDVTVSKALPLAGKGMVFVPRLQGPVMTQRFDDRPQLGHVLAAFSMASTSRLNLVVGIASSGGGAKGRFGGFGLGHIRYPGP